jgi:hypothetical protein
MTSNDSHYWDLDIPGLNEADAKRIASLLRNGGHVDQVILGDPGLCLTLRLDGPTVVALRSLLRLGNDSDPILRGLLEDLEDWLATASKTNGPE